MGHFLRVAVVSVVLICFINLAGNAAVIHVKPTGSDSNSGTSWALAKKTIASALTTAKPPATPGNPGDEIWVTAGVYQERITMKTGVALYGGFAGNETSRTQRNWSENLSVLDGNFGGTVITIPMGSGVTHVDGFIIRRGRYSGNGGGISVKADVTDNPVIANNTFVACSAATTSPGTNGKGGAIYTWGSPSLINNVVSGCSAFNGGAVYCDTGAPKIYNNTFTGNSAFEGGGIYSFNARPEIVNNLICFNSSGIYKSENSTLTVRNNCVYGNVEHNYAGFPNPTGTNGNISVDPMLAGVGYGEVHLTSESPCKNTGDNAVIPTDAKDMDCAARLQDGAVDIGADEVGGYARLTNPIIIRVSDAGNDANDGSTWEKAKKTIQAAINAVWTQEQQEGVWTQGGEIWVKGNVYKERVNLLPYAYVYGGFLGTETSRAQRNWKNNQTVLDGEFKGTVLTIYSGHRYSSFEGFIIRFGKGTQGGGVYCSGSSLTLANNIITTNSASTGGGIYCESGSPTIINNTIAGSSVSPDAGGGICCGVYSTPTIVNNTITGNSAADGGGIYTANASLAIVNNLVAFNSSGIYTTSGCRAYKNNCVFGNTFYNYFDFSGNPDPTGTNGNISVDPRLASAAFGNMHIQPDSPCRNAGDTTAVTTAMKDIDCQDRIQESIVDIGSDESDGTNWSVVPVIIRVRTDGSDANDGSTWALAKKTVQAAIYDAWAKGGEVWVKEGVYTAANTLLPYVYLYGGFAGTESQRSQRDWRIHASVLDGGGANIPITVRAGHQISALDGFRICNGKGSPATGIYCFGSSLSIANNTVRDSSGRGMILETSSPTVLNNHFLQNTGGGISCKFTSFPMIANTTFIANSYASGNGGGIYCSESAPWIINNTFVGNVAQEGGAISCETQSNPTVTSNIIAFNSSGIYKDTNSGPTIRNNCLYENTAYNYSGMGDLTGVDGNINMDPILAGPKWGNVHIQPNSPCRNAGFTGAVLAGWLDMDYQPRVMEGIVDIGADETDGTIWGDPGGGGIGTPVIIHVTNTGNDANDGLTWAKAKLTIQGGIRAAVETGGEVWVKTGFYLENIQLMPFVYVYGGFNGTETLRNQRNWRVNATVIDGSQAGSVVSAVYGHTFSTLDGFTVRNGYATQYGGGIFCSGASPTIANNRITANYAGYSGGGIYTSCASPTICNNWIIGNTSKTGGGIYCTVRNSVVSIYYNTIAGNSSTSEGGGGLNLSSGPIVRLVNNTIVHNNGVDGGGIYYRGINLTAANNIIAYNSSGIFRGDTSLTEFRNNCVYGHVTYHYSGITDPTGAGGNITLDPKLASLIYGNLHIQPTSPCKDKGNNDFVMGHWVDMDGQVNGSDGLVDIGSDESDSTTWQSSPMIVRVAPEGSDSNSGSDWLQPKKTIQAALYDASRLGGEVWVKTSTYKEKLIMLPYAYVYGGFSGTETTRVQRDWRVNATVIDAEKTGTAVVPRSGTAGSSLDGFTVSNGKTTQSGGGIFCFGSCPSVVNCSLTLNSSSLYGGGIYVESGSPTIANCEIKSNTAQGGGGIYCTGRNTSAMIYNNIFASNTGSGTSGGGAIFSHTNTTLSISNNTIINNTGNKGAGIYCYSSAPALCNNIIAYNTSGIYAANGIPALLNNCVYGNTSSNYEGIADPTWLNGNISTDPQFKDQAAGDYHLQVCSPCVDAGDDNIIPAGSVDLDGRLRIQGGHVDMGPYELNTDDLTKATYATTGGFVKAGKWNLVSIPADPIDRDPQHVFAGVDIPNASFQFWRNDIDGGGWVAFGQGWIGPIVRGTCYWFLEPTTGANKDISYVGTPPATPFVLTILPHSSAPYWIMFGTPFPTDIPSTNVTFHNPAVSSEAKSWADAYNLNMVGSVALGFEPATQQFFSAGPPAHSPQRTSLQPWYGYWLLINRPEQMSIIFTR